MEKLNLRDAVRDGKPIITKAEHHEEGQVQEGVQEEPQEGTQGQEARVESQPIENQQEVPAGDSGFWKEFGFETKDDFVSSYQKANELRAKVDSDQFMQRLLQTYEEGKLEDYLKVKATNWDNLSDEQVAKWKLKQDNPKMSEEAVNRLFEKKYKHLFDDEAEEADVKLEKELLTAEADKVRQAQKQIQQEWEVPDVNAQKAAKAKEQEEQVKAQMEQFFNMVDNAPETKALNEGLKTLEDQTLAVEKPEELVSFAKDANSFYQLFAKDGGGIDFAKFYRVANYARNPSAVEEVIYKLGREAGKAEVIAQYQNVETPNTQVPEKLGNVNPLTDKKAFGEALKTGQVRVIKR